MFFILTPANYNLFVSLKSTCVPTKIRIKRSYNLMSKIEFIDYRKKAQIFLSECNGMLQRLWKRDL
jgi:hypothetical protein